jgi:hypothetical protein
MLFFGDELVRVQRNATYSDVWLSEKEIQSECDERFTEQNYIKQDIGASELKNETRQMGMGIFKFYSNIILGHMNKKKLWLH